MWGFGVCVILTAALSLLSGCERRRENENDVKLPGKTRMRVGTSTRRPPGISSKARPGGGGAEEPAPPVKVLARSPGASDPPVNLQEKGAPPDAGRRSASQRSAPRSAEPDDRVRFATRHGSFTIDLFEEETPLHAENFKKLARQGFFDQLGFEKVLENYRADVGGPEGAGGETAGCFLPPEIGPTHRRGSVGAPRAPRSVDPERRSEGCWFYVSYLPLPDLDGHNTVFGQVVEGMDVVDKLRKGSGPGGAMVPPGSGDKILSVEVYREE